MTKCLIDLDGTLSMYPGSDFRSLFNKMSDFYKLALPSLSEKEPSLKVSSTDSTIAVFNEHNSLVKHSAKMSAELMVNRFNKEQIDKLIENIRILYQKYGELLLFTLNHKIVGMMYLEELGISEYFDIENSYFRDNIPSTKKEKVWSDILKLYPKIIYLEDDIAVVNKLKEMTINSYKSINLLIFNNDGKVRKSIDNPHADVQFIHLNGCWIGNVDINQ